VDSPRIPEFQFIPADSPGFPWNPSEFWFIPADSPGFPWIPSEFRFIPADSPGIPQNSGIPVHSCGFPWIPLDSLRIPEDSCPFLRIPAGISGGMKSIVNVCRYSFQHSKALKTLTTTMWTG